MAAVAVHSPVKPTSGRLVLLSEPHEYVPTYTYRENPEKRRIEALEKKVAYITEVGSTYTVVTSEEGLTRNLLTNHTKFLRTSKKDREHWMEVFRKKEGKLPFGAGKGGYHGNDPEVFVVDDKGAVIPAFAFLPSKSEAKEEPAWGGISAHETGGRGDHRICRKMFWDGFQAEFTSPPSYCFGWAADYIHTGLKAVMQAAQKINKSARPTWKPVIDLTDEHLHTSPRECVELGCDPSQNAYFEGVNPGLADLDASTLKCRFAGYHIHFGIGNQKPDEYINIVKMLDAIAGVVSVCLFRGMEDVRRRKYYGLAGEYRLPPHGLEWRTLSSSVLCSPYTFHLMSDLSRMACKLHQWKLSGFWKYKESEVARAINDLDVDLATKILKDNHDSLRLLLRSAYSYDKFGNSGVGKVLTLIEKGALNTLDTDMVNSWKLNGTWNAHSDDNNATIYGLKL